MLRVFRLCQGLSSGHMWLISVDVGVCAGGGGLRDQHRRDCQESSSPVSAAWWMNEQFEGEFWPEYHHHHHHHLQFILHYGHFIGSKLCIVNSFLHLLQLQLFIFFIFTDFSTSLRTLALKKLSVFGIGPLHHWGGVTLSCAPHFPTKYPSFWSSCTFSLRVVYQGFMFSLFASAGMCLPFLKGAGLYSV